MYTEWSGDRQTSSTEAKSSSCSRSARPNKLFNTILIRGMARIESMDEMEFSRWEEHFGSAAFRMTSMYSQFWSVACVTPFVIL